MGGVWVFFSVKKPGLFLVRFGFFFSKKWGFFWQELGGGIGRIKGFFGKKWGFLVNFYVCGGALGVGSKGWVFWYKMGIFLVSRGFWYIAGGGGLVRTISCVDQVCGSS